MNEIRRPYKEVVKRTLTTEVLENAKGFAPFRKKIDLIFDSMKIMDFAFYDGTALMLEASDIVDMRQLSVGMHISEQETGRPADGYYVLPDGRTLKIIKGKLMKIIEAD
jgi:hypothetical protein